VEVSALAAIAAAVADFVVVTAVGIGVGIVLSAILDILFPTPIAIGGVLEYPITPDTDFDTFSDWGEDDGQWYNSLKLYAEVVKTTKEVASADGIPFIWDDQSDSELKIARTRRPGPSGTTRPAASAAKPPSRQASSTTGTIKTRCSRRTRAPAGLRA
jgi:hypothetical protein